jgi:hypothetical protein
MENITYSYKIVSVNEEARCMEVVYTAAGHQTMHIGARLPFEGESLEDVIRMFAPVPLWIEQATPVVAPTVGVTGSVEVAIVTPEPRPAPVPDAPLNVETVV